MDVNKKIGTLTFIFIFIIIFTLPDGGYKQKNYEKEVNKNDYNSSLIYKYKIREIDARTSCAEKLKRNDELVGVFNKKANIEYGNIREVKNKIIVNGIESITFEEPNKSNYSTYFVCRFTVNRIYYNLKLYHHGQKIEEKNGSCSAYMAKEDPYYLLRRFKEEFKDCFKIETDASVWVS